MGPVPVGCNKFTFQVRGLGSRLPARTNTRTHTHTHTHTNTHTHTHTNTQTHTHAYNLLQAPAPDHTRLPMHEVLGVTVVLLTCSYREQEFIRVGYYVSNEFIDPAM